MMEPLNQQERRQAFEQRLAASSERPDPSEIANEPGVSERTIIRDETSTGNTPTTSTPPGPTLTGLELPFVGRSAELDQLETMWQRTANRNGGLALITGESGSGKTRLLREFRSGLDHNHIRTASFKWSGSGTHVPLHTVIESIASNLKVAIPTTLVAQRFRSAHQDASSTITDHLDARVRYYSTLIEWLCDLSAEQPLLLVFDDFHNADSNAMQFFGLAGDRLVNSRCLMVVATRPQFDRDHLDSDVVLSEITLNSGVLRIDLPPLDERSVETIASSALGRQATADELHDVARNTGGNPLLAFEYARHLGTGAKSSHSKRPGDVVVERWRHIDPQTRVVLSYAALKTRPFGPGEIQELGVPTSEWGVRVLLDKAAQQGVLRKLSRTTEIYVFVHDLFSEHFRRILPARESQRIHAHLAASSTDPSGHQINNVQLARHLLEAGDRIPASDRVRVYRDAGWDLIDDHDYYEAHSFFERAAALMGDLRNEVSASIVHGLATSSLAIKPLVEREATHSLVIDAIDRFIELGQTDAALTLSLTSLTDSGGIDHRQIEIYRRGLEIAPPDSIEKALLHARLGRALAVCSGNWNEATVEFNEAERIAVSVDNPEVEVSVLADWVEATDWTGVRDLSGTLAQRCLELNKSVRSARAEYQSYLHLSELAAFESRPVEGLSLAHACLSAAERIPLSSC
ncbi:MAG: AAA family ATPase, partial [Chloroflexi bacterium]|nr:AAA family ATPase [Chloroflexota bacterium]